MAYNRIQDWGQTSLENCSNSHKQCVSEAVCGTASEFRFGKGNLFFFQVGSAKILCQVCQHLGAFQCITTALQKGKCQIEFVGI